MIREFIRYWLGVEDNRSEVDDIRQTLDVLREDVDSLRESSVSESEVSELRSRVRELEGVGSRFTDSEWAVLNALLDSDGFVSYDYLSDEVGSSRNNVRAIVNNLKDKVDLDEKSEGRQKLYDVPDSTRESIFSK